MPPGCGSPQRQVVTRGAGRLTGSAVRSASPEDGLRTSFAEARTTGAAAAGFGAFAGCSSLPGWATVIALVEAAAIAAMVIRILIPRLLKSKRNHSFPKPVAKPLR